jgi:hypothetical protein
MGPILVVFVSLVCFAYVSVIQQSILDLFLLISYHGAYAADLKLLLQLFDEEQAPLVIGGTQ